MTLVVMIEPVPSTRAGEARPLSGLVCEDDADIQRAILVLLKQCGFETVAVACSAREAIRLAAHLRPDIAVIDVALAGVRGLRVVGDLTAVSPGCDVIVLSAFETLRERAMVAGAFALCGMSDRRELRRCLAHALAHRAPQLDGCDCEHFAAGTGFDAAAPVATTAEGVVWFSGSGPWSSN